MSAVAYGLAACAGQPTRAPKSFSELRAEGAVLQTHEYSCGAAALATLMGMFGRPVTELALLESIFDKELPMEAGPNGRQRLRALNLEDLEKGARQAGFKVVSVQVVEREALDGALQSLKPAIARMRLYGEYLHFVVLRDAGGGWVHITDPGYGTFKMPASQFYEAWQAGDKVLMTIGRHPFYAWRMRADKPVYLKRSEKDVLPPGEELGPMELYRSVQLRLPQMGTLAR